MVEDDQCFLCAEEGLDPVACVGVADYDGHDVDGDKNDDVDDGHDDDDDNIPGLERLAFRMTCCSMWRWAGTWGWSPMGPWPGTRLTLNCLYALEARPLL